MQKEDKKLWWDWNKWHEHRWQENKVCDQAWARDPEPDKCLRLGISMIQDQNKAMDQNQVASEWQGSGQATDQRQSIRDWHTNTSGMGRWRIMSTCPGSGVSNLRSTIRIWPFIHLDDIGLSLPTLLSLCHLQDFRLSWKSWPCFRTLILKA